MGKILEGLSVPAASDWMLVPQATTLWRGGEVGARSLSALEAKSLRFCF